MNNVWSIALRLPCGGPRSIAPFRWPKTSLFRRRDDAIRRSPVSAAIAQQRQQWLIRGLSTTPSQCAKSGKKIAKPRRGALRPSIPSKAHTPATPSPPVPSSKFATQEKPVKRAEKAQVQLSQSQVTTILGPGLTFDQGMDLLQELQYRRVTGSLSDKGIDFAERPDFTQEHRTRALDWLRETYPVDEEAAAVEYAEELGNALRKELEERAKSLRLYKRDDVETEEAQKEEEIYIDEQYDKTPLREDQTRDITGESALAARKEYVEASRKKAKIEAEKEAEEMEARGEKPPEAYRGQEMVVARQTALEDARKNKHERWQKLADDAELKTEDIFAERSTFSRLWKPTLFGLTIAGLSWVYALSYEPPKSSMRLFPSISPASATIIAIASLNLLIMLAWRHPSAWKMMNRQFLLSPGDPRAFSIVGSLFSHQQFSHLLWNMAILYVVGIPLHGEVGRGAFLSIYLSSGILGYLSSLTYNVVTRSYLSATIGASAAIFGLVGAYFSVSDTRRLKIPFSGEVEFSSWVPLATIVAWELTRWRLNRGVVDGVNGGTDYLTHLGGVTAGAIIGWVVKKRLETERAEDEMVGHWPVELSMAKAEDTK